jgi:hypothetical protein
LIEKRHAVKLERETMEGFEASSPIPENETGNGGIKGKRPSKKDKLRQLAAAEKQSAP